MQRSPLCLQGQVRGGSPSLYLSKPAMRVPGHLRLFRSCCLRNCIGAHARCLGARLLVEAVSIRSGPGRVHPRVDLRGAPPCPSRESSVESWGGRGDEWDGCGERLQLLRSRPLAEGGGGGAAVSESGGHRIGAPRVHTCAGSRVWCLEAVYVRHVDTRVCPCM